MHPLDIAISVASAAGVLAVSLWFAYARRVWPLGGVIRGAVVIAGVGVIGVTAVVVSLHTQLRGGLFAMVVVATGVAPNLFRWGWIGVLLAAVLPRVRRRRRVALIVLVAIWSPLAVRSTWQRLWAVPSWVGPPEGFRCVARLNYPEARGPFTPWLPFRFLELRSSDTATPRERVLRDLEARLSAAGWQPGPDGTMWRPRAGPAALRPPSALSALRFTRGDDIVWDVVFCVYDVKNARVIEVHLRGDFD